MLVIERLSETESGKQKVLNLDHYDDLMVVSRNAAQLGLAWMDRYWPQLPVHLRWFAVGKSTAACLEDAGIAPLVPAAGFNSEALLQLPALQQLTGRRILILKGEGGRELLEQTFAERGAQVDSLALYRRVARHYSFDQLQALFVEGIPDALIATSGDVLKAMDALIKPCLNTRFELPLVVASERIAEAAKGLGYRQIIISEGAAGDSIVRAFK